MNELQILLIVVIVSLSILLMVIGIQILFIIAGIRRVIQKVNAMLEGKDKIEEVVTKERINKVVTYLRSKLPIRI